MVLNRLALICVLIAFGLPVGITFMASAWSEPTLIRLASGFEAATEVRRAPEFEPTFEGGDRRVLSMGHGRKYRWRSLQHFLRPRHRRPMFL